MKLCFKKYHLLLTIILTIFYTNIYTIQRYGNTVQTVEFAPGCINYEQIHWLTDSAPYNKGGLIFTFPEGLFSQPPHVTVMCKTDLFNQSEAYSCITTDLTERSVTVYVSYSSMEAVEEADSKEVIVTIMAIGE